VRNRQLHFGVTINPSGIGFTTNPSNTLAFWANQPTSGFVGNPVHGTDTETNSGTAEQFGSLTEGDRVPSMCFFFTTK
jgi:hypothetical protein